MKSFLSIASIFISLYIQAQSVGIGTNTPHSSAILELSSLNKGFLMSRMTTAQRNAIASPAKGLMIYNLDQNCINVYDGTYWNTECEQKILGTYSSNYQSWIVKNTFNDLPRFGGVAFAINNLGYVCAGEENGFNIKNDLWEYNPNTNAWSQKADILGLARKWATAFVVNNKAYVGLGFGIYGGMRDFYEYNPATNNWRRTKTYPGIRRVLSSSFSINGKGYTGLGYEAGTANEFSDFYAFTPPTSQTDSGSWLAIASFPMARRAATSFALNNKGYVCTGQSSTVAKNDLYMYDNVTNAWVQKANYPGVARINASSFVINNEAYVGLGSFDNFVPLGDFYKYNPSTDVWTAIADFIGEPRVQAMTFSIANSGYVIHGGNTIFSYISPVSDLRMYEYNADQSTGLQSMEPYGTNNIIKVENKDWTLDGGKLYTTLGNVDTEIRGSLKVKSFIKDDIKFTNVISPFKITLMDNNVSGFSKYSLGVESNAMRYNVPNSSANHLFYTGNSKRFSINGSSVAFDPDVNDGGIGIGRIADGSAWDVGLGIGGKNGNTWGIGAGGGSLYIGLGDGVNSNSMQTAIEFNKNRNLFLVPTSGNVGIGTTIANGNLQFANVLNNRKVVLWETGNNNHQFFGLGIESGTMRYQVAGAGNVHRFYAGTSAATSNLLMTIYDNGSTVITGPMCATAYNTCSDGTLKKNILPLTAFMSNLLALQGYSYQWKDEKQDSTMQSGFIAQEVEKLFPHLVKKDEKGLLSVNYPGLIPYIVEIIKTLNTENEALKEKEKKDEKKLELMEERIEKLEAMILLNSK